MTTFKIESTISELLQDWQDISDLAVTKQAVDIYRRIRETQFKKELRYAHLEASHEQLILCLSLIRALAAERLARIKEGSKA